ncbi:MAG: hypothetical protein JNL32_02435 [Candidatus Kapabacteria bacterium]|nr:hypothetical protein [Candidatus Kapabacteria bacterium]
MMHRYGARVLVDGGWNDGMGIPHGAFPQRKGTARMRGLVRYAHAPHTLGMVFGFYIHTVTTPLDVQYLHVGT